MGIRDHLPPPPRKKKPAQVMLDIDEHEEVSKLLAAHGYTWQDVLEAAVKDFKQEFSTGGKNVRDKNR